MTTKTRTKETITNGLAKQIAKEMYDLGINKNKQARDYVRKNYFNWSHIHNQAIIGGELLILL